MRERNLQFEWDEEKEKKNIAKHGLNFSLASRVFTDYDRIEEYDDAHSENEDRYITIGKVDGSLLVIMVVYTKRFQAIRIISARLATKIEEEEYYDRKKID